jgi:hypothetical protein
MVIKEEKRRKALYYLLKTFLLHIYLLYILS